MESNLFCDQTIGPWAYDPEQPTFWTELCSWLICKNIEAMQQQGFVLDDGVMAAAQLTLIWPPQTTMIDKQSAYVGDVAAYFNAKYANLPRQDPMWLGAIKEIEDLLPNEIIAWFANKMKQTVEAFILTYPALAKFLSKYGSKLVLAGYLAYQAWEFLKKYYTTGAAVCTQIKAENDVLKGLTPTTANYRLRQQIISQHDLSIANLLDMVGGAESQSGKGDDLSALQSTFDELNDTLTKALLTDNGDSVFGQPLDLTAIQRTLDQRLQDLAYVDIKQDYGNFATYIKGRTQEF